MGLNIIYALHALSSYSVICVGVLWSYVIHSAFGSYSVIHLMLSTVWSYSVICVGVWWFSVIHNTIGSHSVIRVVFGGLVLSTVLLGHIV